MVILQIIIAFKLFWICLANIDSEIKLMKISVTKTKIMALSNPNSVFLQQADHNRKSLLCLHQADRKAHSASHDIF